MRQCLIVFLAGLSVLRSPAVAQTQSPTANGRLSSCDAVCPGTSLAKCHEDRALYLLKGWEAAMSPCLAQEMHRNKNLVHTIPGILLGIQELDSAITTETGNNLLSLQRYGGPAFVELGNAYVEAGDFHAATEAMQQASDRFLKLFEAAKKSPDFRLIGPEIVVGLIHAGKPIDALTILNALPLDNVERTYFKAETLFSMGNRDGAAKAYEQWVAGGCHSEYQMLTNDEFGPAFTFLALNGTPSKDKCGSMPQELRERLLMLARETYHPNNIPRQNNPSIPLPTRDF